ncbi:MAG: class I SAM-dependent methyltransferase [Gemmatimonadaceae bacterium]
MSWFQPEAAMSLGLIGQAAPVRESSIIDVGAGASRLVDGLLERGYRSVTVLDVSAAALDHAQRRLATVAADAAGSVTWHNADVLTAELPESEFDVWHDRAVFHFLTDATDRAAYTAQVRRALRPHGYVIIATFAEDGPTRCSGLDVHRYSPDALQREFGDDFRLVESQREEHHTPWESTQAFTYCLLRYEPQE